MRAQEFITEGAGQKPIIIYTNNRGATIDDDIKKSLPVTQISFDQLRQWESHKSMKDPKVADWVNNKLLPELEQNGILKPLLVWNNDGEFFVIDGNHRFIAYQEAGYRGRVPVQIVPDNMITVSDTVPGQQGMAENKAAGINKMFNNLGDPVYANLQRVALLAMQGRQQEAAGRLQTVIKHADPAVQKKITDAVNSIKPVTINGRVADSSILDKSKQHNDWITNTFIPWVQSLLGQQGVAEGEIGRKIGSTIGGVFGDKAAKIGGGLGDKTGDFLDKLNPFSKDSAIFLNPNTVIVGQQHGQPLELSPNTLKKIQTIAAKHGAWYEGNGTDRGYTKGQIDRYVGSWDDEVAKTANSNDPKWIYVLFANVDENNRVQRVGVDPNDTIFNRLLDTAKDNSFQGIGYTSQALQKFLQMASEGKYDFLKMSQQPATQENLTRFLKAGEALMWPSNWEQYPNRAGKIAKAATVDVRDQYLATRKAGVYVTGSGHLKAVQNITGQQGVAEGLTETRNSLFAFVKQQFPTWPDYVLKDFLYPQAKGIRDQAELDDFLKRNKQDFGNCKWTLTELPITFDIFTPKTQRMLASREGGSSNPFQVPRDAERHAQQSQMIQQKGVSAEPIIIAKLSNGYDLIEGWHRTIQHLKAFPQGYTGPAWVCTGATYKSESVEQDMAENFADGKNPGRKGLAKRSGVDTKASVSSLRKTAKNSSGEKQRMAHWLANMKAGRAKANRK